MLRAPGTTDEHLGLDVHEFYPFFIWLVIKYFLSLIWCHPPFSCSVDRLLEGQYGSGCPVVGIYKLWWAPASGHCSVASSLYQSSG